MSGLLLFINSNKSNLFKESNRFLIYDIKSLKTAIKESNCPIRWIERFRTFNISSFISDKT